jgi:hypothetical protein
MVSFSGSYQLTHDTNDNLTMILDATSQSKLFACYAVARRYGRATVGAFWRHSSPRGPIAKRRTDWYILPWVQEATHEIPAKRRS